jgi:hypothetical protein
VSRAPRAKNGADLVSGRARELREAARLSRSELTRALEDDPRLGEPVGGRPALAARRDRAQICQAAGAPSTRTEGYRPDQTLKWQGEQVEWLTEPDIWIGFVTLLALEVVLGIDNVVFISILAGKLSTAQQARARQVGLGLALAMRILLLLTLSWAIRLTSPLFSLIGHEISGRDLILILGGAAAAASSGAS